MKAVVYQQYGSPDELQVKEVPKPSPSDKQVLVKVIAASVNASDWEFLTGRPMYVRMWGLRKPKHPILGSDIAGIVEAVGSKANRFQKGDAVFGDILGQWGGFAEYVCATEDALSLKPDSIPFQQAATLPQAALVALQGLRDAVEIQPGQQVLINGAGGGSGSFALQLAQLFGAEVTGVDNSQKLNFMRSLGASQVIDYTREDFTKNGVQYDLILDFVASHSIFDYKRSLKPKGVYLMVGGSVAHIFQTLILGTLISSISTKTLKMLMAKPNKDLDVMIELVESGEVVPIIDNSYPLEDIAQALWDLGEGRSRGKLVITINE